MKKFTQSDMILHNGDVYVIGNILIPEWYFDGDLLRRNVVDDNDYWQRRPNYKRIGYSTASLEDVKQLDRQKFVKPVDIGEIAFNYAEKSNAKWDNENVVNEAFKAGYNANKAEFTKEEVRQAMADSMAFLDCNPKATVNEIFEWRKEYLNKIRPISIPKSITIQNDEIINVEW